MAEASGGGPDPVGFAGGDKAGVRGYGTDE